MIRAMRANAMGALPISGLAGPATLRGGGAAGAAGAGPSGGGGGASAEGEPGGSRDVFMLGPSIEFPLICTLRMLLADDAAVQVGGMSGTAYRGGMWWHSGTCGGGETYGAQCLTESVHAVVGVHLSRSSCHEHCTHICAAPTRAVAAGPRACVPPPPQEHLSEWLGWACHWRTHFELRSSQALLAALVNGA